MLVSPENLIFNGINLAESFSDSAKGTYFIVNNVDGRGVLGEEISTIEVPGMAGAYQSSKYTPTRTLSVSISLKGESFADLRKKIDRLSSILITDEPVPIKFSDEPDVTYYGSLGGVDHKIEVSCIYQAVLNFLCTDPFKYGEEDTVNFQSDVLNLQYDGTAPASPIFELEVLKPVTFAMVQNQYDEYQLVGVPTAVDEQVVDTRTLLFEEVGKTLDQWTSDGTAVDRGNVSGRFDTDDAGITVPNYGTGKRWHGPALMREIPGTQDFEVKAHLQMRSTEPNQVGRVEFYLYDEHMNVLGKMAIVDNQVQVYKRYGEARFGPFLGEHINYPISSRNYFYDWNYWFGMLRFRRIGKTFEFYITRIGTNNKHVYSIKKTYVDNANQYAGKLKYVQIHIARFGDNPRPYSSKFFSVSAHALAEAKVDQTPYIARPRDIITLDNFNKEILINGEDVKNLKDFGGSFFNLQRGENQLIVHPANSFITKVRYSDRYK